MPVDATLPYDEDNIFARILRGEVPCERVYEDDHALAFNDINPQAPVHVLVVPKGAFVSWDDFSERGSAAEIAGFVRAVGWSGYVVSLLGGHGGQEVPHLHVHLFGGRPLGPMLAR